MLDMKGKEHHHIQQGGQLSCNLHSVASLGLLLYKKILNITNLDDTFPTKIDNRTLFNCVFNVPVRMGKVHSVSSLSPLYH